MYLVVPPSLAERGAAQDALASEPRLLQSPLLSHIGDLGGGLDAVDLRMGKQVADQQSLRLRTVAESPELRRQPDTEGPVAGRRPGLNPAPGNNADTIGAMHHD